MKPIFFIVILLSFFPKISILGQSSSVSSGPLVFSGIAINHLMFKAKSDLNENTINLADECRAEAYIFYLNQIKLLESEFRRIGLKEADVIPDSSNFTVEVVKLLNKNECVAVFKFMVNTNIPIYVDGILYDKSNSNEVNLLIKQRTIKGIKLKRKFLGAGARKIEIILEPRSENIRM